MRYGSYLLSLVFMVFFMFKLTGQEYVTVGQDKFIYLWTMESKDEVLSSVGDRNSVNFELSSKEVLQGSNSLKLIPDGKAKEIVILFDLNEKRMEYWKIAKELVVNLYVPENMEVSPKELFLGLYDVTKREKYIGGICFKGKILPGWNKVYFALNKKMLDIDEGDKYVLLLSVTGADKTYIKSPIVEPFYIDGIYIGGNMAYTKEELLSKVSDDLKEEVSLLLDMNDEELLTEIERKTFYYFWKEANPENGLVRDRSKNRGIASVAAVGWALSAIPIGIERGWITKEDGYARVLNTLNAFSNGDIAGDRGFFYHFVDIETGNREWNSELSSIDTALFIAGAIFVGEYFKGTEVEKLAVKLYENVDWEWMLNEGDSLSMGWKPEIGFLAARWNFFNEGVIAGLLAVGSPTFPVKPTYWSKINRFTKEYAKTKEKYIYISDEVLCMYQYPHNWFDLRDKEDRFANYFNNTIVAINVNRQYAIDNAEKYKSYGDDLWGISPSDGPSRGGSGYYQAYGAVDGRNDGTIAPNATVASIAFNPELTLKAIREMLMEYGALVWGEYGFVSAFNEDWNWYSDDYLGIDQGNYLLMIENYRTGLIWKYFMQNENVIKALKKAGFRDKVSEYAVTPIYSKKNR